MRFFFFQNHTKVVSAMHGSLDVYFHLSDKFVGGHVKGASGKTFDRLEKFSFSPTLISNSIGMKLISYSVLF